MRLSRRGFIKAGAAGAAGAAALSATGCDLPAEGSTEPTNVLLLIVDSLRPDHVGAYGSPQVQTPNIDWLAARGLRFNRAFPEAMVTLPARRSIFTSRRIFPFRNFKPNPELGRSPGWEPIENPDQTTFTSVLKRAGYWTAQVSDNPFLAFTGPYEPFRKTFARWDTIVGQSGFVKPPETVPIETVEHWLPPVLRDDRYVPGMRKYLANTGAGVDEEQTCAARVYKKAIEVLDDAILRQPFCMTVDCFDPHEPWSPPRKYIDMYGDPEYEGPEIGVTRYGNSSYLTPEQLRRLHAVYAAEVTMTDHWLGKFLEAFREKKLHENTVILLLSDHGYLLGERGVTGKVPVAAPPRAGPGAVHRGAPRWPRRRRGELPLRVHPRRRPHAPVAGGRGPPDWMEGLDLSPLMDGEQPSGRRPFHYGGMYNRFFIRTDEWLLIGDNRGAGTHDVRPQARSARVLRRGQGEPEAERGAVPAGAGGGRRAAAVLRGPTDHAGWRLTRGPRGS